MEKGFDLFIKWGNSARQYYIFKYMVNWMISHNDRHIKALEEQHFYVIFVVVVTYEIKMRESENICHI